MKRNRKDQLLKRDFDAIAEDSTIPERRRRELRRILKRQMTKVDRKRRKVDVRDYETISEDDEF